VARIAQGNHDSAKEQRVAQHMRPDLDLHERSLATASPLNLYSVQKYPLSGLHMYFVTVQVVPAPAGAWGLRPAQNRCFGLCQSGRNEDPLRRATLLLTPPPE